MRAMKRRKRRREVSPSSSSSLGRRASVRKRDGVDDFVLYQ